MAAHRARLSKRADQGRYWWELRSCDYYGAFEKPKIVYQDLAFHSRFALDDASSHLIDTCFLITSADLEILALLNSSVIWSVLARIAYHGKDEAIRLKTMFMEELPIPPRAHESQRLRAVVGRILSRAGERNEIVNSFLALLRERFDASRVTERMRTYWEHECVALEAELQVANSREAKAELRRLHERSVSELMPIQGELQRLEIELQHLVFDLYGLTPDDVRLLRSTVPPRDPLALVESAGQKAVAGGERDGASSVGGAA